MPARLLNTIGHRFTCCMFWSATPIFRPEARHFKQPSTIAKSLLPGTTVGRINQKRTTTLFVFSGVETPIPQHEERIKEDGTITLSLIGSVKAEGKTPGQLQKDIRDLYVPKYYSQSLNVTVKSQDRFFYVGGEVKANNRYPWVEGMTIVKAIQNAGGFTDYAKSSKVRVTRADGKTFTVNYDKAIVNPELDVPIYPDDSINVPRKW